MAHCVVSLSGGMDSSTLLLRAIEKYDTVTGISFDYGQKHRVELERAQSLVQYLNQQSGPTALIRPITYRQIQLNGLVDLLDSALVTGGEDVPEGHYAEDNMKATVVPNRNKIFASITQAVALSVANRTGETCDIAMGIHAGDHAIYPDCRQEFRDEDFKAFKIGNWDREYVYHYTPYLDTDKFGILKDGLAACNTLGFDFDEVYKRTNTSYKPDAEGRSDYKSASSVERIEAFLKLGRRDPVKYIDGWETAKKHVTELLAKHA